MKTLMRSSPGLIKDHYNGKNNEHSSSEYSFFSGLHLFGFSGSNLRECAVVDLLRDNDRVEQFAGRFRPFPETCATSSTGTFVIFAAAAVAP